MLKKTTTSAVLLLFFIVLKMQGLAQITPPFFITKTLLQKHKHVLL